MVESVLEELDVLVVGGGFAGIYQLDRLRSLRYSVKVYESGSDLGGVWHSNSYPGARVDTCASVYQFSREDLWRDWDWSELYPDRDEMCRYFHYVDDKLDLSSDIRFDTTVIGAEFDEHNRQWIVRSRSAASGQTAVTRTRYLFLCLGFGSKPLIPDIQGIDSFAGECHHTAQWPQSGIDLNDKRVGVIGTGASGVQVIQEIAKRASHLTVFQRTPNMALPMRQQKLDQEANQELKQAHPERFASRGTTFAGFDFDFLDESWDTLSAGERMARLQELWDRGGLLLWLGSFKESLFEPDVNAAIYNFWRDKILQRVDNPDVAETLAPRVPPHPWGTKRVSLEQNYFEAFNQNNVSLIDVRANPIDHVTHESVVMTDGSAHDLDVLVLATGFDTITGGMASIDIRSTTGESLGDAFAPGVRSAFGKAIAGFPNLLCVYGPLSPSVFGCGPTCAELEGEWLVQCVEYMQEHGFTRIEATYEAEKQWKEHVDELTEATLLPQADAPWFGVNVPGKKREMIAYPGGVPTYLQKIGEVADAGYSGFELS